MVAYKKIGTAFFLNLNEESEAGRAGGEPKVSGNKIKFTIGPSQIITIGVDFLPI